MILTFSDFGHCGPYLGLMRRSIARVWPEATVIDLMCDVPAFNPRAGAYLLQALRPWVGRGDVVLAVVDPGVGSERHPMALEADGAWFVGPDNGLLERVGTTAEHLRCWGIRWRPDSLSPSFHGRDLFAPVAAALARDAEAAVPVYLEPRIWRSRGWSPSWPAVIYVDHYGNAMTGLRASAVAPGSTIAAADQTLSPARTFSDVAPGVAFWYANSLGLVEIAVNQGSAAECLGLAPGDPVWFSSLAPEAD